MSQENRLKIFNPSELLDSFADSGLDTSIFESIDESKFRKAPNFLTFVTDPEFLNATILPKQVEMGTKLFADHCPICSEPGYIDQLYDQDVGTIRRHVVFLEHGKCPKCESTRFDFFKNGQLNDYNEFAGCLGQRCIPADSLVYTHRGLIPMAEVEVGDIVSHGVVKKVFDSGSLPLRTLRTEIGWDLRGSKDSHIVPVLMDDGSIVDTPIRDIQVGNTILAVNPDLWPSRCHEQRTSVPEFPKVYDVPICAFLGMVCREFTIDDETFTTTTNFVDTLRSALFDIFGIISNVSGNTLTIHDKQFIKWFKEFTDCKPIPDGVLRTTGEAASMFVLYFLDRDVISSGEDSYLQHIITDPEVSNRLRLLLLNDGKFTAMKKVNELDVMFTAFIEPEDEDTAKLLERGYFPLQVESIEDSDPVPMIDLSVSGTNLYVADGFLHHNSGKSKFIGLISNYQLHRMLCISNPIRFFNQSAGDIFGMSFAGLTEEKVEKNLWSAFVGFMDASPWFQKYHSFLEEKGKELKQDLLIRRKSYIQYNHKKILCDYYGSNGTTMRGDTRFFGSIDEIGWMSSGEDAKGTQMMNADTIYTSINNSLSTLRMKRNKIWSETNYDVPPILIANISSPSSSKDKIMKQVKSSKTNPKIYAVQQATWTCNPDYTEDKLWAEFSSMDAMEFYRDFGASPPVESNPFLSESTAVDRIAIGSVCDLYSFSIEKDVDSLGDKFLYAKLVINRQDSVSPRLLAFDLGSTNNAFGMAVFKVDRDSRPILENGLIIKPRDGHKLNLPKIFDMVTVPMVQRYNVRYVFFDKWQSLDQVSRLREMGIDAQVYSLKYADIANVRGMITGRGVLIPKMVNPMRSYLTQWEADDEFLPAEISAALGIQLLTVRDSGIRFLKPTSGDDDFFRAFALGVNRLSDFKVIKAMGSSGVVTQQQGAIGVVHSLKGGAAVQPGSGIGVINSRRR